MGRMLTTVSLVMLTGLCLPAMSHADLPPEGPVMCAQVEPTTCELDDKKEMRILIGESEVAPTSLCYLFYKILCLERFLRSCVNTLVKLEDDEVKRGTKPKKSEKKKGK